MRKIMVLLSALFFITVGNSFAAPINTLDQQQIVIGIVGGSVTDTYYLEQKITNNVTLGIQYIDSDVDCYGQLDFSNDTGNSPKLIIGNRNFDSGSITYLGAAIKAPISNGLDGYALALAGKSLQELQVGITSDINESVFMNLNYRLVKHHGTDQGIGIGLGCRI
ncbi:hypothetical protein [Sporomusa sp. KB1]|uniref:hypothetical protein n=1 Tax=Sporomusa sp. KB1 TaxID=943346 RepID=UPI00119ECF74|nr:hypothetical protein [Sporomusa sp. KB1]TWH45037.1 hypothetical protein Salpa_0918 [Sporomusa sp. KB1]